jgi:hypothetical protein
VSREGQKQSKDEWAVKKATMHAQAELDKESSNKDDDDNASQTLQKSSKSKTRREWMNLIIKKESLHNNGKQWALSTKANSILLDSGSMLSLFGNLDMVTKHKGVKNYPGTTSNKHRN